MLDDNHKIKKSSKRFIIRAERSSESKVNCDYIFGQKLVRATAELSICIIVTQLFGTFQALCQRH